MLIGFTLLVEGFDVHIPKGYVYFAMAFALLVDPGTNENSRQIIASGSAQ